MVAAGARQTIDRTERIEHVASHLLPRASLLTRLLVKQARAGISRSEGGVLSALTARSRRITELAELEGLAQPTMTLLVKRLEDRGWLARDRQVADGRVVLVSLTEAGWSALEEFRSRYRAVLRAHIVEMSDAQLAALEVATEALDSLIGVLQQGGAG